MTEIVATQAVAAPLQHPAARERATEARVEERPDKSAALITARLTRNDVRIADLTTETAEFFAQPDGQITARMSAGPVRTKRRNGWVPIDLTLRPAADGSVEAVADLLDLRISGARTGGGELVSIGSGDRRLALGWPGKLPTPALAGNRATYSDVTAGVDLVIEATRGGFEQFFVVKSRDAVERLPDLSLPLMGKNLAAVEQNSSGGLTLRDGKGGVLGTVPAPEMWDARRAPGTDEPVRRKVVAVKSELAAKAAGRSGSGGKTTLRLRPDLGWLKNPATQFPVTIDPQVNALHTSFDTYVREDSTVDRSSAADLQLGVFSGTPNANAHAFVHWPVKALAGKQITAATVNFWNFWSNTCAPNSWEIWSTGAASSATRWGSQPAWLSKEATSTESKGYSAACDDGWVGIDGKNFFQRAANAGQSTAYMGLRATDETTTAGSKLFRSRAAEDTSQVPYATITYNSYPTVNARSTIPTSACVTGDDRPTINTVVPQLSATVSDAEGSPVNAEFEWWALAGTTKLGSTITGVNASGSAFSAQPPPTALAHNNSYKWRVRGNDGTVDGAWSPFCEFTVDTTIISPPIVTSAKYPMNAWGGDANVSGQFTFDPNGVTDAVAYEYSLDVAINKTINAPTPGAPVTVTLTPTTPGWHNVQVRTRDATGKVSDITSYPFKVGSAAITSPVTGDVSGAKRSITAITATSITKANYQWRRAGSDTWVNIPVAHVTYAQDGAPVAAWPIAVANGIVPKINWDIAATLASVDAESIPRDGPVQLRGQFDGGGVDPVKLKFDRNLASADTSEVGPGSVNLITGNFQTGQTDAQAAGLSVSRVLNSRQSGGMDPLFGPGWVASATVTGADSGYTKLSTYGSLVQVGLPDGTSLGFTKSSAAGTAFEPEVGAESYTLVFRPANNTYTLTNEDGNVVTFGRTATDPLGMYTPMAATSPGADNASSYSWEKVTVDGQTIMRPTRLLAPVADGVTCTSLVRGCKALEFRYSATTTATGTADGAWGAYTGRIAEIAYTAWDPDLATPAMRTISLTRYAFDSTGRLRAVWDPRLDWTDTGGSHSQRTTYAYASNGVLVTMTPPAKEPWQFTYTTQPHDPGAGRLAKVTRSALSAGSSVETVVYQVPVSGAGAPYDLSAAQTNRWGQTEPPTDATAIFPATQVPTGNPAAGVLPGSYERATVNYLNANARTLNVAEPGGYLSTTWYGSSGNVERELGAGNRQRALEASASDSVAVEAQLAAVLSEVSIYSPDGQRLLETFGPEHDVVLPVSGNTFRGRSDTRFTYDEGAPETGGPFDLVTTERRSVSYVDAGVAVDADVHTTTTQYDWTLRKPKAVAVDPGDLDLITRTRYDAAGRITATTTPAGGGSDETPSTRVTIYYAGVASSTYPECGGRPEWAGQVCQVRPGGPAEHGPELLIKAFTYDVYGQQRTVVEKNTGGTRRTVTVTYDGAGRPIGQSTTTASGLGKAIDKTRMVYDVASGEAVRTQTVNASQIVTAEVVRTYDTLGRQTSYTDADGNTSTTTYNVLGQVATSTDGKATRTYTYDEGTERRGLPTSVNDSQAGIFAARRDADGAVVAETWPNGVSVARTYDQTGTPVRQSYERPGCGQASCGIYYDAAGYSIHTQKRWASSTFAYRSYDYDQSTRLAQVSEAMGSNCTIRQYGFDDASNRTSLKTYAGPVGGLCQSTNVTSTRASTYDNADRATSTGYVYDVLGRTTALPAAETANPASGHVAIGYYVNDMVSAIAQGGRTADYTLDVLSSRVRSWTDNVTGAVIRSTHHYADDGDKPVWTQETATRYTRVVSGMVGMAAIWDSSTSALGWNIANLNGDVIAGISGSSAGLAFTRDFDEYGVLQNSTEIGKVRYGWLGQEQRAGDAPGGLMLMGVRLYNPSTARFLSTDPVYGGNANAYDYCAGDAVNCSDTSGAFSCSWTSFSFSINWKGTKFNFARRCNYSNFEIRSLMGYGLFYAGMYALMGGFFGVMIGIANIPAGALTALIFGAAAAAMTSAVWIADKVYEDRCSKRKGIWVQLRFKKARGWAKRAKTSYSIGCR